MELTLTHRLLIVLAKLGVVVACIYGLVKIVSAVKSVMVLGPLAWFDVVPGFLIIISAVIVYALLESFLKLMQSHSELRDTLESVLKKRP